MTLRMTVELNERLMSYCDSIRTAANTYINGLIESALARSDPGSRSLRRPAPRSEPKVMVSIRMEPELHERLNAYCEDAQVSANAFVRGLVQKDLNQKGM